MSRFYHFIATFLPEVLKLGSTTRINERCLELQKKKKDEATKMKVRVVGLGYLLAVVLNIAE